MNTPTSTTNCIILIYSNRSDFIFWELLILVYIYKKGTADLPVYHVNTQLNLQ